MKKFGALVVLLIEAAACGSAFAADLPTHKPAPLLPLPYVPAPSNWTGFYAGASLGYGFATAPQTYGISSATLAAAPPIIPVIQNSGSQSLGLRGVLLGDEVGYNFETTGGFVYGVAADSEWSLMSGKTYNSGDVPNYGPGYPYSVSQKFDPNWQGSLRARVGFAPVDSLLLYATGGLALAHYRYTSYFTDVWNENEGVWLHGIQPGWTLGVGAEYMVARNWSVKGEYRYTQFAAEKGSGSTLLTDGTTAYGAHSTGTVSENTVKVGLNYHFQ